MCLLCVTDTHLFTCNSATNLMSYLRLVYFIDSVSYLAYINCLEFSAINICKDIFNATRGMEENCQQIFVG
jgi:hypothetical protein